MKVVADNKIPFLEGALEPFADIDYFPGKEITSYTIKDADALLIRTRTKCDEHLLKGSAVKFIATATIGYDHIDTGYCRKAGIHWTNAPGCNSSSVQQYIASALITLSHKKGFDLTRKSLGVVGVGNVGSKVVSLAEQLNMTVYLNDPPRERKEGSCQFISLAGILRESDIITFHVPLITDGIDKTFHMVNEALLRKMNKGTIIINSSRGEVIDSDAFKNGIKSGHISGAVLDVWENEPCLDQELLEIVDIATPHIAGYSADGKANGTTMIIRALSRFFDLGVNDWIPAEIPDPPVNTIRIDCTGKSDDMIVQEAISTTYDITDDDRHLRNSVDTFEKQRGEYPLRREYHAYHLTLSEDRPGVVRRLKRLKFNIETN